MKLNMGEPNFVGLYAGCGGADIGFVRNGFKCAGAFDINSSALQVHERNINCPIFNVDLSTFDLTEIYSNDKIDIVFSGAPCQGFSTAGKRELDDPRNSLLIRGGEIALALKTKIFVSENVMGSFAGAHKKYWNILEGMFRSSGYKTFFIRVNCLDLGMAQMRKRILFFAWKNGAEMVTWPVAKQNRVLRDVLLNVEHQENHYGYVLDQRDPKYKIALRIKEKQKLCNVRGGTRAVPSWDIPEVFGRVTKAERDLLVSLRALRRQNRVRTEGDADPVSLKVINSIHGARSFERIESLKKKGFIVSKGKNLFDLTQTFNGKYRRLALDAPCPTVDTRFGNPTYFLHPKENRGFTVREAARIQGFADDFIFGGSLLEQFRMIGNAVPPPLSQTIASIVKDQLLKA
jgi:DNA (cytosine-5)-methyltransferase 1